MTTKFILPINLLLIGILGCITTSFAKTHDASLLHNLAKVSFSYDLDGDGRGEEVLLVPSGENDEGQFFSLTVLDDKAGIIWSGPKELNSENPLVFGEWHYGISMPEVIGDIDGDGVIELVSPAPQSDISPTAFRILRWENGAFEPLGVSTLLETPQGSGKFPWTSGTQYLGAWVSSFLSINKPGEVTVEITEYRGGVDVKMRKAELRKDASGFEIVRWIDGKSGDVQSTKLETYRALLSREDHVNSRGIALTDVVSILRQDRANYHLNRHRDSEDESDSFFAEASGRKLMKQRSVQCEELNCEQSILGGTPLVEVTVDPYTFRLRILQKSDAKRVDGTVNKPSNDTKSNVYKRYISAYKKLTELIAANKGSTPEAQEAYEKYKLEKELYQKSLKENGQAKNIEDENQENKKKAGNGSSDLSNSIQGNKTKSVGRDVKISNSSPIFLDDEMYQYYKTPAQVVYIYTANSLFSQSNVTNVGSPKIKAKQVSIDFVFDGKKKVLVFIEKSRKENEAVVMVGPPRSDATDIYQLRKIKGSWAIVGVKHSNGMQ